jgi:hypothetical protein
MGMPEAALDRHFGPDGLAYIRILHKNGKVSDEEMEIVEALWPTWTQRGRDLLPAVRGILA